MLLLALLQNDLRLVGLEQLGADLQASLAGGQVFEAQPAHVGGAADQGTVNAHLGAGHRVPLRVDHAQVEVGQAPFAGPHPQVHPVQHVAVRRDLH